MEHYVSFHKVLDYLKQEQQNSPRLNNFGYGDLEYFMNDSGTTTTYPFLFVTPINIGYAENTTTYSLQMIFADIVNTDLSNEKDVVSDMSLEARRFLSVVKRGFLDDKIDVSLPAQATTFFERFNDHVGGVVLNADIVVFEDINACDPYPTPTPTITPTSTLTPTPTPTPNSYPVVFVSSGATFDDICSNPQPIPTLYSPQPFFTDAQQLYYDSGLTQFIDWTDANNQFFASTGGTQLYFYGYFTDGLSTYGFTCPSPTPTTTPTITPTNTTTPTNTPTTTPTNTPSSTPPPPSPSVTPSSTPTACYTFSVNNSSFSGTLYYGYENCNGSSITFVELLPQETQYICSRITPYRQSGVNSLSTNNLGACVSPTSCKTYQITQSVGLSTTISYDDCDGNPISYTLSNDEVYTDCFSSYPIRTAGGAFTITTLGSC